MSTTVVQAKTGSADLDTDTTVITDPTVTSSPVSALPAAEEMPLGHQPRESAVPCSGCQQPTWSFHARCNRCEPVTCQRCSEPGRATHVIVELDGLGSPVR